MKGADGKNYFFRLEKLRTWLMKKYGNPDISTRGASELKGNKGIYIMRAKYPNVFRAYGHGTLYNMTGTVGKSFIGPHAHDYSLWKF